MISDDDAVEVYRATLAMLRALGVLPAEGSPRCACVEGEPRRACKICGARCTDGEIVHGRGCYAVSAEGGGTSACDYDGPAEDDARAQAVSVTADLRAAVEGVTELIAALERQRVQIGETMAREDADARTLVEGTRTAYQERDEARALVERQRRDLQRIGAVLIEQIGATGPELAVETAERAASVIADMRDQIAQHASRAEDSRAYAERCMRERDEAREALDSIGDMLIGIEPGLDGDACRVVGRCISDAKWRKQPEFSERPASLRGEIARLALARDEALAEAKRWQGSGVYATAIEALRLAARPEDESIVDVVPRLVRERVSAEDVARKTGAQLREARDAIARAEQSARRAQEQAARALGTTPEGLAVVREVLREIARPAWSDDPDADVPSDEDLAVLAEARDRWIAAGRPLAG